MRLLARFMLPDPRFSRPLPDLRSHIVSRLLRTSKIALLYPYRILASQTDLRISRVVSFKNTETTPPVACVIEGTRGRQITTNMEFPHQRCRSSLVNFS